MLVVDGLYGKSYQGKKVEDSVSFADVLLEEEKVAAVPGTAFGNSGEGFLRISYAYSLDNLKIAMERFKRFVEKLRAEKNNQ